jgi:membrane-bound lytic murein transglycosylase MltF
VANLDLYVAGVAVLVIALLLYRSKALKRFDQDPEQHYIASQLVAVVSGRRHTSEAELRAHLDRIASSPANRRARVIHAVLLVRKSASPALYGKVLELSRRLQ